MLASILTNEVFAVRPKQRPPSWKKTGIYNGKYVMVSGVMYDLDIAKPRRKLAKRVAKALMKLTTTKAEDKKIEAFKPILFEYDDNAARETEIEQQIAYSAAVEMLKEVIAREEDEEFIALLLEL